MSDAATPVMTRRLLWLWTLVPLATLGLAAFLPPTYFAVRSRRRSGYVWAALLLAALVAFFIVDPGEHRGVRHGVAVSLIMLCWLGGFAVAIGFVATELARANDPVAAAVSQERARKQARRLAHRHPQLAIDAHIGRPDLPGVHADGGLVDVNRVSADVLATLPGISHELADRIVATRHDVGGYASIHDMIDTLNLDPRDLDDAADRLLFLPL